MTPAVQQGNFGERAAFGSVRDQGWSSFFDGEIGQPCFSALLYTIYATRCQRSRFLCTEMATESDPKLLRNLIQRVLDEAPFSMRQLAEEAGISYDAIRSWATERRTPRPESLELLATALKRRGERLCEIADDVRRATPE